MVKYEINKVSNFRLGGFATGGYTCECSDCGAEFIGDKRAIQCLDCAIKIADKLFEKSLSGTAVVGQGVYSADDLLAEIEKYLSSIEISEGLPAIEINKDCSGAIRIESKYANVYKYKTFENLQEFLKIILSK